jgi:ABC-type proline/glycine betaine transport system permease subunit
LGTDWLTKLPFSADIDLQSIDSGIRALGVRFDGFFSGIKVFLNSMIYGIRTVLDFIPWWLLILIVFVAGWRMSGKLKNGIMYAVMLFLIGVFGLWKLMNETLAIIIASVLISLILGFPVGVLMSGSERVNRFVRPILDTMQTMPVFVYLIPAVIFFGLGNAPAVISTVIYAIVPVIRLTSHGIRQVDVEVVEAAKAFGSTRLQALIKVQIPQALPTIMAGVNQTIMMAMAMVVTCSMIGATGLGMEVLIGVNRLEIGRGIIAGTAVVIMAIVIDRLTQSSIKNIEVKNDGKQQ